MRFFPPRACWHIRIQTYPLPFHLHIIPEVTNNEMYSRMILSFQVLGNSWRALASTITKQRQEKHLVALICQKSQKIHNISIHIVLEKLRSYLLEKILWSTQYFEVGSWGCSHISSAKMVSFRQHLPDAPFVLHFLHRSPCSWDPGWRNSEQPRSSWIIWNNQ